MNRRLLLIIIATAGVLLLGTLILLVVVSLQQPQPTNTNTNSTITNEVVTNQTNTNTITTTTTNDSVVPVDTTATATVTVDDEASLRRVIANFTERFGSYSTDTNYENIALSKSLMTETMAKTADKIVKNDTQTSETFYSVESRVMTTTLTDYVAGATGATAEVDVRQTIVEGQSNPQYRNQTARLTLKRVDDTWKVDSFVWQ